LLKFYHYTSLLNYHSILFHREFRPESEKACLTTGAAMIPPMYKYDRENRLAYKNAVFGVLEEEPEKWWSQQFNADEAVMETLLYKFNTGSHQYRYQIVALEITLDDDTPVYIADWGVHLNAEGNAVIPINSTNQDDIKKSYANSLVHLSQYRPEMNYRLPEVVCFADVPFENMRLISRDNVIMLVERMREKYKYGPSDVNIARAVPIYECPIVFD
jgi:hypothetical protein